MTVRSIHVQYTPVDVAYPGGSAAFAIRPKGKGKAAEKKTRWCATGWGVAAPRARRPTLPAPLPLLLLLQGAQGHGPGRPRP